MKIYSVPHEGQLPRTAKTPCFLLESYSVWNDEGFVTTFKVYFAAKKNKPEFIGKTKIMQRNVKVGDPVIFETKLPKQFSSLDDTYCSLGETVSYYRGLVELGKQSYEPFLEGIGDVVFKREVGKQFEKEPAFKTSLVRFKEAADLYKDPSPVFVTSPPLRKIPLTTASLFETSSNSYKQKGIVGEGATGRVYKVEDQDKNTYALKVVDPQKLNVERRKRLRNEINFCRIERHKNVIVIIDEGHYFDGQDKHPFYVMPLYDTTLRNLLNSSLTQDAKLRVFSDILDGVEAAHMQGVIHRDLKPENILCRNGGIDVVVADFGIAQFAEEHLVTSIETKEGSRLANFVYAAPEQKRRDGTVDKNTDIYALGLILNELFTGHVIQGVDYKTIDSIHPQLAYLDDVVKKMVCQTQSDRLQTVDAVKKELIARKADFVQRQKLDELQKTVIPETELVDPVIKKPVAIESQGLDYQRGKLLIPLNQDPPVQWINCLRQSHSFTYIPGLIQPGLFGFENKVATISIDERHAQEAINLFKEYVIGTNIRYAQMVRDEHNQKLRLEKEYLQKQIDDEKRRQSLLKNLKI
jgi:serine/threonine protein kinase